MHGRTYSHTAKCLLSKLCVLLLLDSKNQYAFYSSFPPSLPPSLPPSFLSLLLHTHYFCTTIVSSFTDPSPPPSLPSFHKKGGRAPAAAAAAAAVGNVLLLLRLAFPWA